MPNISEYTGPILTYFAGLVVVLVAMIIPILVWQLPRDVAMQQVKFIADITRNDLYSFLWRSATDWPIINPLSKDQMAMSYSLISISLIILPYWLN